MKGSDMNSKGQITIFIIIGVLIVAAAILIYMFYPQIKSTIGLSSENPEEFLQTCLEDAIEESADALSAQGGSLEPEFYYDYLGERIEYLCYAESYYTLCAVQQPMLIQHIESEIKEYISDEVSECFSELKTSFENKGYSVGITRGEISVELLPKRIATTLNYSVTLAKEDTQKYDSFSVILNNNLYELASIANSIINWEATYGDAETTTYMNYYHDLKVEKKKESDGTTIYILTDRNNENKFQFASRSLAWPAGYGSAGVY